MTNAAYKLAAAAVLAASAALAVWVPAPVSAQSAAAPAEATNSIETIEAIQTGAGTIVRIQLREASAAVPPSFSVANPARIAIDLAQTSNGLGRNLVDIQQGDLRSVNVVQAQGRSRIVLNLSRAVTHAVSVDGKVITVALGSSAETASFRPVAAPAAAPAAAAAAAAGPRSLRGVDFRRGSDGEGRVVVDLTDPGTSVDVRKQGSQIVVDFLNTSLPEALRRRIDVSDFGTPVSVVNTVQQGANVRMTIEPRGLWEQNAYQTDTRFVVEIKPVKEDPTRLIQGGRQGYQGERLSLNFQNVDVRSLLQVIADFTNLNIITSDSVQGQITLRLKDVPWDQALDIILQSRGLDMRKNGNVLIVAPREEIATKEKLELESRNQISELEPIRAESFVVNYAKADDVRRLISDDKQRLLSKRGSAVVDPRTNQLFVQDTAARLEDVRRLLQKIDVPVQQVLIEARIVEADDTFSQNLGVRFGVARLTNNAAYGGGTGVITGGSSSGSSNPGTGFGPSAGNFTGVGVSSINSVNLPAAAIGGFQTGNFALTLVNSSLSTLLNLEVSALQADGRGKIVSSPRVITADKVKATIEQGTEIPYQQATSSGATSVSFKKAVLKLEVTPQITPEGAVFLDVKVNKDSRGQDTASGPAINTKNVQTQVLVENGGTVVLGGIYEQEEQTTITKVPFLGDLPVVGYLFKNRKMINDRKELMIFITPRVVSERVAAAVR